MQIEISYAQDMFGVEEYHEERIEVFKFVFERAIENAMTMLGNAVISFEYNPDTRKFRYLHSIKINEAMLLSAIDRSNFELKDFLAE